jgi:hypothetical protein
VQYVRDCASSIRLWVLMPVLSPFLVYLLHAYDYAPEDPMICLCLAIASIGRAMQRQSDNRQHLIAQVRAKSFHHVFQSTDDFGMQGLAFLSQYRNLRGIDSRTKREVEYNFGRTFHQLGECGLVGGFCHRSFGVLMTVSTSVRLICLCCQAL